MAHRPRREPVLLTTASGGKMPDEGRVEPETEMSLAAGIVRRVEGRSPLDNA